MSILIGKIDFDWYDGALQPSKYRVESFERTDVPQTGAQVMPKAGRRFSLQTTRHEPNGTSAEIIKNQIDNYIGTIRGIVADSVNYASLYGINFVVVDAVHEATPTFVRARGYRAGFQYNYAPARAVITNWVLQSTPVV